ncbi:hypothetical protein LINPERPRIM_LOCUS19854 [Linum perenne]
MTTSSSSFIIILIILLTTVGGEPNTTYVESSCSPASTDDELMRSATLEAIDHAIDGYQLSWEKATCICSNSIKPYRFYASAMCWGDISFIECRHCLWNAQFRLVDQYCQYRFGGQLTLTNCFLRVQESCFCSESIDDTYREPICR